MRQIKPVRVLLSLLALALLSALLVEAGRQCVLQYATEKLQNAAKTRGLRLSWDSMDLGYDLSASILGLKATSPAGSSLFLEEARASFSFAAVIQGSARPESLQIRGLRGTLQWNDTGLREWTEISEDEHATSPSSHVRSRGIRTMIRVEDGDLEIVGLPRLSRVRLSDMMGSGDLSSLRVQGACREGCGQVLTWTASLERRAGETRASLVFSDTVPFFLRDSQERAGLRSIKLFSSPTQARLALGDLRLHLLKMGFVGDIEVEKLTLESQSLREMLSSMEDRKQLPSLHFHKPKVTLRKVKEKAFEDPKERRSLDEHRPPVFSLPDFQNIQNIVASAVEDAPDLQIHAGEIHLSHLNVHLRGVSLQHRKHEPGLAVQGEWMDEDRKPVAMLGATLHEESQGAEFRAKDLRVSRALRHPQMASFRKKMARWGELDGKVDASILIRPSGEGFRFEASGVAHSFTASLPDLSTDPVLLKDLRGRLQGSYDDRHKEMDRLTVEAARFDLPSKNGARGRVEMRGMVEGLFSSGLPVLALEVSSPEGPCADLVGALPAGILPNLYDSLQVEGRFSPSVSLNLDFARPKKLKLQVDGFVESCRVKELGEFDPSYLARHFKQEVREGTSRGGIYVGPASGSYVRLKKIPEHARAITYLTEDSRFYENKGLSPGLITRALKVNLDKGRYAYGGSTISQQLVKNLFLTRNKTLSRKLEEAFIVWKMEEVLSKDRILELYMNCIEYGPDIYGIQRASRHYFGKSAKDLTPLEGAFLASLKPAPWLGGTYYKKGKSPGSGYWLERMDRITAILQRSGHITEEERQGLFPYVLTFHRPAL